MEGEVGASWQPLLSKALSLCSVTIPRDFSWIPWLKNTMLAIKWLVVPCLCAAFCLWRLFHCLGKFTILTKVKELNKNFCFHRKLMEKIGFRMFTFLILVGYGLSHFMIGFGYVFPPLLYLSFLIRQVGLCWFLSVSVININNWFDKVRLLRIVFPCKSCYYYYVKGLKWGNTKHFIM